MLSGHCPPCCSWFLFGSWWCWWWWNEYGMEDNNMHCSFNQWTTNKKSLPNLPELCHEYWITTTIITWQSLEQFDLRVLLCGEILSKPWVLGSLFDSKGLEICFRWLWPRFLWKESWVEVNRSGGALWGLGTRRVTISQAREWDSLCQSHTSWEWIASNSLVSQGQIIRRFYRFSRQESVPFLSSTWHLDTPFKYMNFHSI